jgi:peptidoglycan hydrolase CwlO-like protein
MTQLFVQLSQSVAGNVITIVALNIVAATIGFFTAWLYAKSVYIPVIKGLEADKANLNNHIATLKDDINSLNEKVNKLNEKIGRLEEEIAEKDKKIKDHELRP